MAATLRLATWFLFFGPARAAFVITKATTVLTVVAKVDPARHAEQPRALITPQESGRTT